MEQKKVGTISAAIASILLLIGYLVLYFGNVSMTAATKAVTGFFNIFFSSMGAQTTTSDVLSVLFPSAVIYFSIGMAFVAMALAAMTTTGLYYEEWKLALFASVVPSVIGLVLFNFSLVFLVVVLSVIVFSLRNVIMSQARYQELKKFNDYRVGSNTVGKALMWITIAVAAVALLSVVYSPSYKSMFQTSLEESVVDFGKSLAMDECLKTSPEEICKEIVDKTGENLAELGPVKQISGVLGQLFPLVFVMFFVGLMSILKLFLSIVAGLTTLVMIRIFAR